MKIYRKYRKKLNKSLNEHLKETWAINITYRRTYIDYIVAVLRKLYLEMFQMLE